MKLYKDKFGRLWVETKRKGCQEFDSWIIENCGQPVLLIVLLVIYIIVLVLNRK